MTPKIVLIQFRPLRQSLRLADMDHLVIVFPDLPLAFSVNEAAP